MKKIMALLLSTALIASFSACGSSPAPAASPSSGEAAEKSFTLKFSDQNAEGTSTNVWAKKFAELVSEKTKGTVTVDIYANATLTAYDIEPLQSGIADFLQYVPSSAADLDPRLAAFDAPYIYESDAHRLETFNPNTSAPLQAINESIKESNVILLSSFCSGYRQITCNYPIKTLNDIKGAKIRVVPSDLYLKLFGAFGAAATPMNFTEVSTALITNVIDGQENPLSVIVQNSLFEVQDYLMMTSHMPTNHGLFMNYTTFQKLSPNQQQAVKDAAYEASAWMDSQILGKEEEYRKQCEEKGMTVIDETNGLDLAAFENAARSMYDLYAEQWGDMVEQIKAVKY